jgi:hypothetical protein
MPGIRIADETWVAAPQPAVAAVIGDEVRWPVWWPDLQLEVTERRGLLGVRWAVAATRRDLAATGSMEVWLLGCPDGVLLHYFLRLDPVDPQTSARRVRRAGERHRRHARHVCWAIKDELEAGPSATVRDGRSGRR